MNKVWNWLNEGLSGFGIMLGINISEANEIFGLVLVVMNIIILVLSFIIKAVSWTKDASKDGKITQDELHKLEEIVVDTGEKVNALINKTKENENE